MLYLAESVRNVPKLDSHHHVELELNLVQRGWITYIVGERRFTFHPRTLLWLYPDQEHHLIALSPDAQFYVAVFKPSLIARSCHTPAYTSLKRGSPQNGEVLQAQLVPEAFDLIRRTMESVMQGSLDPDVLNREAGYGWRSDFAYQHCDPDALNAGLRYLLLLCWRAQQTGRLSGEAVALHRCVRRAIRILNDGNLQVGLDELARASGTSEAYLSRTFRKQIGVPLSHYRNTLRLSQFWEEFRQPEQKTVSEAVYAAGFGSYAQFYKVFTQAYGQGPRAFLGGTADPRTLDPSTRIDKLRSLLIACQHAR
jgi:methylphosphotriester-DNA--protein-cysteine methyltransferase